MFPGKKYSVLKKSHIIPKFVSKWLKETSATGFLRGVKKPEKRMQDLPKLPLLCGDCEQRFSKLESYFARKLFHPILNEKKEEIDYDDNLHRFIISLSWRTLVTSFSDQVKADPWIEKHLNQAEVTWRRYLLKESSNSGSYEHYLFFVRNIESEIYMPKILQWYILRATDSTLASNQNQVFSFTHFPHFFFVSTIVPFTFSDWKSTKIERSGKFTTKSQINDHFFWDFIESRGEQASPIINGSANKQIAKSLEKDPEKFLKSESFLVFREVSKRQRLKRIEKMPETIKNLIDILDRSVDNPELDHLTQRWAYHLQYLVADALSCLLLSNAIIIDQLIQSTIVLADEQHKITNCTFETQELIAKFMVTICDTKHEQLQLLEQAVDNLKKMKKLEDKRIIVVFSFNPLDPEMPYETGYYSD